MSWYNKLLCSYNLTLNNTYFYDFVYYGKSWTVYKIVCLSKLGFKHELMTYGYEIVKLTLTILKSHCKRYYNGMHKSI